MTILLITRERSKTSSIYSKGRVRPSVEATSQQVKGLNGLTLNPNSNRTETIRSPNRRRAININSIGQKAYEVNGGGHRNDTRKNT